MSDRASDTFTESDPRVEAFLAREPYFSVLTSPRFLRANLTPEREREFFESGDVLVDWMLRTIDLRLHTEFAPMSILEYGCGVGRLAIPLAARAASVTAVDRSPVMLEMGRAEARRRHLDQIEFMSPRELFATPRKFDLVICYLVLQRLPAGEGLPLLQSLLGLLGARGIGVLHLPYHTTASRIRRMSRAIRARLPLVNGASNLVRGRPFADPFVRAHVYDLGSVMRTLEAASVESTHVALGQHEGLASAVIFVEAPASATATAGHEPVADTADGSEPKAIDVRELVERTSIDDLHRSAEEYFASLADWDHHLAKPFNDPAEAATLLEDVVRLLQGLELTPGATVLEFGAGTGWLSRFLTQLGCRTILLDVSPTALRIARALYDRQPVLGPRPQPEFLVFDGRRIDLPDASVDRVVVFHAFHHTADPASTLAELARVLKPGGIAGFAEPGPRHSQTPRSQFEMRTYGVIENDVDVLAIWRAARACGFRDLKLAVFHAPSFHVSLEEYQDLLAGGAACARWVASTRGFLRHVRTFFLYKEGARAADSRSAVGLASRIHATLAAPPIEGQPVLVDAVVTNTGTAEWLASNASPGGVLLGAHLYDTAGKLRSFDAGRYALTTPPRAIAAGESLSVQVALSPLPAGDHVIELDVVAEGVTWFAQVGSQPATLRVTVEGRGCQPAPEPL